MVERAVPGDDGILGHVSCALEDQTAEAIADFSEDPCCECTLHSRYRRQQIRSTIPHCRRTA